MPVIDTRVFGRRELGGTRLACAVARFGPQVQEVDQVTDEITHAVRPDVGRLAIKAPLSLPFLVAAFTHFFEAELREMDGLSFYPQRPFRS